MPGFHVEPRGPGTAEEVAGRVVLVVFRVVEKCQFGSRTGALGQLRLDRGCVLLQASGTTTEELIVQRPVVLVVER